LSFLLSVLIGASRKRLKIDRGNTITEIIA